jgi:lysophospholipid acyltransferase (LPLAT)-like uncharacterized protein
LEQVVATSRSVLGSSDADSRIARARPSAVFAAWWSPVSLWTRERLLCRPASRRSDGAIVASAMASASRNLLRASSVRPAAREAVAALTSVVA